MPPKDDVLPTKEQPLHTAVSPTTNLQGYITESDPEEDSKEDDEDPKKDPADYLDDKDDDDDEEEEESSRDDADDEEEEHLAPADSSPPFIHHVMARMSVRAQTPISLPSDIEVARFLAIPSPPPSPLSLLSSPLP
ncbi:hypothetical protein Tco_0264050 [Tanacetum coccineum]